MSDIKESSCAHCVHWQRIKATIGECRAKSPATTISLQSDEATISNKGIWPKTFPSEWCSEFRKSAEIIGVTDI